MIGRLLCQLGLHAWRPGYGPTPIDVCVRRACRGRTVRMRWLP